MKICIWGADGCGGVWTGAYGGYVCIWVYMGAVGCNYTKTQKNTRENKTKMSVQGRFLMHAWPGNFPKNTYMCVQT